MVRKSEPEQQPVGKGRWCSPAWVHVDVCCPQRVHWAQQMLRGGKSLTENQTTKQPAAALSYARWKGMRVCFYYFFFPLAQYFPSTFHLSASPWKGRSQPPATFSALWSAALSSLSSLGSMVLLCGSLKLRRWRGSQWRGHVGVV